MTSLVIEHLDMPESPRYVRALHAAGERAGEVLAGRTVWCAMSLPSARRPAEELRVRVDGAGPGAAAATLRVEADEPLRQVAERVEDMLDGAESATPGLGETEHDAYALAAVTSDELFGGGVEVDDVVVVHDALSAIMIEAVRERGAHAVWSVPVGGRSRATARQASEFLRPFTPGIDAYIFSWRDRGPRGEVIESVGAAMPAAGIVAATEFPTRFAGGESRRLAWRMALAEIVRSDRGECVGGTLHPCPTVATR